MNKLGQKPNNLYFTYKFNEELDRIYNCFTNFRILTEVTLEGYLTNFQLNQAITLDGDGVEFSYCWKKKYSITMKTEKVIKSHSFRGFTHRAISIKEVDSSFDANYCFFYNSCEHCTIFKFEVFLKDKKYLPLFDEVFPLSDKMLICKKLENYLKNTNKDLVQYESIVINQPMLKVWNYVFNLKNLLSFGFYNEKAYIKVKGSLTMIGSIISIYETESCEKLLKIMYLKNILMSNERIKFVFETKKNNNEPLQTIKIMIENLPETSCLLIIKHKFLEYSSFKYVCDLGKRKRHTFKVIKNQLEES